MSITAAFRSIEHLLHLPFTYTEILPMVTRMCETQNLKTNENNELAGFWETVDILASSGKYGSAWTTTSKRPRKKEFRSKNQKRHWSYRKGHATYPYHSSVYRSYTPRKAEIPKAKRYPVTR